MPCRAAQVEEYLWATLNRRTPRPWADPETEALYYQELSEPCNTTIEPFIFMSPLKLQQADAQIPDSIDADMREVESSDNSDKQSRSKSTTIWMPRYALIATTKRSLPNGGGTVEIQRELFTQWLPSVNTEKVHRHARSFYTYRPPRRFREMKRTWWVKQVRQAGDGWRNVLNLSKIRRWDGDWKDYIWFKFHGPELSHNQRKTVKRFIKRECNWSEPYGPYA